MPETLIKSQTVQSACNAITKHMDMLPKHKKIKAEAEPFIDDMAEVEALVALQADALTREIISEIDATWLFNMLGGAEAASPEHFNAYPFADKYTAMEMFSLLAKSLGAVK